VNRFAVNLNQILTAAIAMKRRRLDVQQQKRACHGPHLLLLLLLLLLLQVVEAHADSPNRPRTANSTIQ
jgi:hypothetical protein